MLHLKPYSLGIHASCHPENIVDISSEFTVQSGVAEIPAGSITVKEVLSPVEIILAFSAPDFPNFSTASVLFTVLPNPNVPKIIHPLKIPEVFVAGNLQ